MCNKVLSVCVSCTPAASIYCFCRSVTFSPLLFLDCGETKVLSDAVRFKILTIWAPMVAAVLASLRSALMRSKNGTFCHYHLTSAKALRQFCHTNPATPLTNHPFIFSTGIASEQVFSVK